MVSYAAVQWRGHAFPEPHPYCLKERPLHRTSDNGEWIEAVGRLRDRMKERKGWAEGPTAKGEREQWEGRMDGRGRRVVEPCIAG